MRVSDEWERGVVRVGEGWGGLGREVPLAFPKAPPSSRVKRELTIAVSDSHIPRYQIFTAGD